MLRTGGRRLYWVVPMVGLLGFLDEMRLGARVFDFSLPVGDGIELDSFHDLLILIDRAVGNLGITRIWMIAVVGVLISVAGVFVNMRGRPGRIADWCRSAPPITLIAAAVGFLLIGAGFDLIGSSTTIRFDEEVPEFAASGLVAIATASIFSPGGPATTDPPGFDTATWPSSQEDARQRSPLRRPRSVPPVP